MMRPATWVVATFLIQSCQFIDAKQDVEETTQSIDRFSAEVRRFDSPQVEVIRKRTNIIRNTLVEVLELNRQGMCLELGTIPCADVVHLASLGGMAAYSNSQYEFSDQIDITAPIALERVTLSACIQRAQLDLLNPAKGVIFKDLKLSTDGRLVLNQAVDDSIDRLIERAFFREANNEERAAIRDLYVEIYEEQPQGAAINWMILSCFTVLTSLEAAFY